MKLRVIIFFAVFISLLGNSNAQVIEADSLNLDFVIDIAPKFNGGDPMIEFGKFIDDNLQYPKICLENKISGKTVAKFIINKKGKISKVYIVESNDPAFTKETKRVLKMSPLWTPGQHKGELVEVYYTFPISFRIE